MLEWLRNANDGKYSIFLGYCAYSSSAQRITPCGLGKKVKHTTHSCKEGFQNMQ